jgi:hypothetical protein
MGLGVTLGPMVGIVKGVLSGKRSKNSLAKSLVGSGVMVACGDGTAVGIIVTCGVGIVVGIVMGNRVGIVIVEDEPVRWFEIRSLALMASTGVHTMERIHMDTINGKNFIGIPRGN